VLHTHALCPSLTRAAALPHPVRCRRSSLNCSMSMELPPLTPRRHSHSSQDSLDMESYDECSFAGDSVISAYPAQSRTLQAHGARRRLMRGGAASRLVHLPGCTVHTNQRGCSKPQGLILKQSSRAHG
jgi:hypothetical protein